MSGRHTQERAPRATLRDAFAVRDFRAIFVADALSLFGDQIAAVAVSVLIYERSQSPLLAAVGYATAYLPWVLGGPLLSAWAERQPARRVMIGCDLARAALIGLAALPQLPLPALCALVFAAALLAPPFTAARGGVQARVLTGDRYTLGLSALGTSHQVCQLVGFAGGGVLVALLPAPGALVVNALTFLLSAVVLTGGLSPDEDHPPEETHATDGDPAAHQRRPTTLWREAIEGLAVVRSDRRLIGPLLLCVVGTAYGIVPEAVAAVLATSLDHGASGVGVLLAAAAAGAILSDLVIVRLVVRFAGPRLRRQVLYLLALVGTLPLLLLALHPGYPVTVGLIATAGLASGFVVLAQSDYALAVPAHARARAFGIAGTALYAGQSVAILAGGAAAQFVSAQAVIAGGAGLGALGVLALMVVLRQPVTGVAMLDLRDDAVDHAVDEALDLRTEALHR